MIFIFHHWHHGGDGTLVGTFRQCTRCGRYERATYDGISPGWQRAASPVTDEEAVR